MMFDLCVLGPSLFTMTFNYRTNPNNVTSSLIAVPIGMAILLLFETSLKIFWAYCTAFEGDDVDCDVGDFVFARLLALSIDQKRVRQNSSSRCPSSQLQGSMPRLCGQ